MLGLLGLQLFPRTRSWASSASAARAPVDGIEYVETRGRAGTPDNAGISPIGLGGKTGCTTPLVFPPMSKRNLIIKPSKIELQKM